MRFGDVGAQALANLARHKLRTILTVCGVAVGVATLTIMVSLGEGVRRLVEDQFSKADLVTRVNVLSEGVYSRMFGRRPGGQRDEDKPKITDEVVAEIAKLPGVVAAYPDVHSLLGVELAGEIFPGESEGFPTEAITETHTSALLVGRYWNEADEGKSVVVVPSRILEDLRVDPMKMLGTRVYFMRGDQLGRYEIVTEPAPPGPDGKAQQPRMRYVRPERIKLVEAEVIGVYDSQKFGIAGARFQVPLTFGKQLQRESGLHRLSGNEGEYPALTVRVASRTDVKPVRDAIAARWGFETFAIEDLLKGLSIFFTIVDILLAFFGSIGLIVSFFGIANTMVMAVLERTREIGVFKAIGARDRDVRRIFLIEAALIGALGGGAGVGAGWGVGAIVNAVASYLLREPLAGRSIDVFYVPAWLALGCIGVSTLVAAAAGLYPAWRAARLDPVVSLRME